MGITIREMIESDIDLVSHVANISWHDTYKGILPDEFIDKFVEKAYSRESLQVRLKHTIFLVAEKKQEIIGFISIANDKKEQEKAELAAIYLLPEVQGEGVGTKLLKDAISRLEDKKELIVYVEKENEKGVTFYQSKGFQVEKEFTEELLGQKVQTIVMKQDL